MWGYYESGTGLEMSGHGSSTLMTLKGDHTKTHKPNSFDKLFNLFFLQNHYFTVQPLGPHSLLSSGYLTFGSAG